MSDAVSQPQPLPALWPFVLASSLLAALALAVSFLLAPGAGHAARAGVFAAALGGACALPALRLGASHGLNGLLAGVSAGFFARMICVAAGLLLSGARGSLALVFAAAFFLLYAATQSVEIGYVFAQSRAARAAGDRSTE